MANQSNIEPHKFKPGQSGNPAGKPKGIKNWSTIVQDLLADEELLDKIYKRKPDWLDTLPTKNAAHAIVAAMAMQALKGDRGAADWLRKTGFGDMLDVTSAGERIEASPIIISEVKARNAESEADTTDGS